MPSSNQKMDKTALYYEENNNVVHFISQLGSGYFVRHLQQAILVQPNQDNCIIFSYLARNKSKDSG